MFLFETMTMGEWEITRFTRYVTLPEWYLVKLLKKTLEESLVSLSVSREAGLVSLSVSREAGFLGSRISGQRNIIEGVYYIVCACVICVET